MKMFASLSFLAVLVTPLVSALTLQVPENPTSGGQVTIRWTSVTGDPESWSCELNNEVFHNSFAIANNVDLSAQQLTLTLPVVPVGSGYTLQAVDIGNITNVYATSAPFAIGAASSISTTSTGTSSTGTGTTSRSVTTAVSTRTPVTQASTAVVAGASTAAGSPIPTAPATASAASSRLGFDLGGLATVAFSVIAGISIFAL